MQPEDLITLTPPVEENEREPFWGYLDLLLLIGLLFASLIVLGLLAAAWARFDPAIKDNLTVIALPLQLVAYAQIYLCFFLIFKFRYNRPVFASLGWRKTNVSLLAAGFGGVLLALGLSAVAQLIGTPKVDTAFDELVKTPFSTALLAVTAVVLAPIFEEMLFRGFLQPLLSRTLGVAAGVLITALLFGSLHASEYKFAWQYVAAITVVGVALGAVRAKKNSLIPGTVMHGCFNAVSIVGLIALKYFPHK
jgi:membrane protease YdiL (CAAX protease family)